MRIATAYLHIVPWSPHWLKVFAKELPLEGSAVLYLLQEPWVALNFSWSSFQRFLAIQRCESSSVLNTQRRHKPESKVFSDKVVSPLDCQGSYRKRTLKSPLKSDQYCLYWIGESGSINKEPTGICLFFPLVQISVYLNLIILVLFPTLLQNANLYLLRKSIDSWRSWQCIVVQSVDTIEYCREGQPYSQQNISQYLNKSAKYFEKCFTFMNKIPW